MTQALQFDARPGAGTGPGLPIRIGIGAPASVVAAAKRRGVVLPDAFYGVEQRTARAAAFSIAGLTSLEQLQAVKNSLDKAFKNGDSFAAWRRSVLKGDVPLELPSHRLETIFRTNMQTSYMVGRGVNAKILARTHPYLLYSAVNDSRTRPAHAAMSGTILPLDDPWWSTHRPPNGYNCRCTVIQLTKAEAMRRGITNRPPGAQPDPGFDNDPWEDSLAGVRTGLTNMANTAADPIAKIATDLAGKAIAPRAVATVDEALAAGSAEVAKAIDALPATLRNALDSDPTGIVAIRDAIAEKIAEVHGAPVEAVLSKARGGGAAAVREASKQFPSSWINATNAFGPLEVRTITGRAGQFTKEVDYPVRVLGIGVLDGPKGQGIIRTRAGDHDVAVHEFAHRVQAALPELDGLFQAYYDRRTIGEALQRLTDLLPGRGYGSDEFARPDGFLSPYFGKVYATNNVSASGALEMMTMTLEHFFSIRPAKLARLFRDDRELFDFAVGLLLGWMP